MRVYEVFLKKEGKEEFRHAGSLEAADDELALVLARETYARRAEGDQCGSSTGATSSRPSPTSSRPNADKPHRHNDGAASPSTAGRQRASGEPT